MTGMQPWMKETTRANSYRDRVMVTPHAAAEVARRDRRQGAGATVSALAELEPDHDRLGFEFDIPLLPYRLLDRIL